MMQLLPSRCTLNHIGRLKLCTFLHGNGIGDANIRKILAALIKPRRDKDVDGILVSLDPRTYDSKWHYFSVAKQIRLYLNGTVAKKLNDYTRLKIADYADYGVEYVW
jgi:translation initiation factor RLI1